LWLGGAVIASSLLDKPVDRWAANRQTPSWNRAGTAANGLTYGLVVGAGLLYTGIAGEGAASTGETAIKAAAYTLGASIATRYVMGRSRPTDGLGNTHFGGFKSSAWQSGFPSNHVAVAFALATPFAQQHDMPWLYGVAAATAFGRVQKRQHWVSDTVAGAAMGYAIGSLLTEQGRGDKGMRLSVTPQSVSANWAFK
jgi:membrane-associated phospholipid phosphatase